MKIVFASNNLGKITELHSFLAEYQCQIIPQATLGVNDIEETGLTFVENAILKARNACIHTGLPAIADDSGLEVKFLNGEPGIYSARYAGKNATAEANIHKLLSALKECPDDKRQANFYCTLVYLAHANDPTPIICEGTWPGFITQHPIGDDSFGYNPIFFDPEANQTAAQMNLDQKKSKSHRGKALHLLMEKLKSVIQP